MPEQVFNDRYQIVRHLARGGMAEVYVAHDRLLDRPVALKVLFSEHAANRSFVERFRREARAAANLNHPNIVAVYDWGEEGQTYFIVMEYVEGRTVRELILQHRRLSPKQAAAIGGEIAAALAFAHANGVIHRDVKPGNVIISDTGHVKVTDFGIARAGDPQDNLTQTGAVMGTATYFSPEQAQGKNLDARSDLYSLGVVLYEMVSGVPPFTGESPVSIAYQHVRENPVPLRQRDPRIPVAFEAIVAKAMAKQPGERYNNAEELRTDLLRFRDGAAVAAERTAVVPKAGPAGDATAVADGTQVLPAATTVVAAAGPRRRTGAYVGLLVLLLALLGGLLFLLARSLGVAGVGAKVAVPDVFAKTESDAVGIIQRAGFNADPRHETNDAAQGLVFSQDPAPGTKLAKGRTVVLHVSTGPAQGTVPGVTGLTFDNARSQLIAAGFQAKLAGRRFDPSPSGTVVDQNPDAGAAVPKGTVVLLTVSNGPAPTTTEAPSTTEAPTTTATTATTFPTFTTLPRRTTTTEITLPGD